MGQLKGRETFSANEIDRIKELLRQKSNANRYQQQIIRNQIRDMDFYISDFTNSNTGFSIDDLDELIRLGRITITDSAILTVLTSNKPKTLVPINHQKDEAYVIDLCDEALKQKASRQHRFSFLLGDTGTPLPVDAYYRNLNLVVEYRERQHSEPVKFFDKPNRLTVSNVHRGEQRKIYDQRRREILPKHGMKLIEISYSHFRFDRSKKIIRDQAYDYKIVCNLLEKWLN